MAQSTNLDKILPTRRYLLDRPTRSRSRSRWIALICRAPATTVAWLLSPQGDGGRVTAWQPAIQGTSKVRNSTVIHLQPITHRYPRPRRRFCRVCRVLPDTSRAPHAGARFGDSVGTASRHVLK